MNGFELGDLATWVTAGAIFFAGSQYVLERRRWRHDQSREVRAQALMFAAWAVSDRGTSPVTLGVVVSNGSHSIFHDVEIHAVIHKQTQRPIQLRMLPPGEYFLELSKGKWEYAISTAERGGHLRPYTGTDDYFVRQMNFTDSQNKRWRTDERLLLHPSP